jgi:hypothetical protein
MVNWRNKIVPKKALGKIAKVRKVVTKKTHFRRDKERWLWHQL